MVEESLGSSQLYRVWKISSVKPPQLGDCQPFTHKPGSLYSLVDKARSVQSGIETIHRQDNSSIWFLETIHRHN